MQGYPSLLAKIGASLNEAGIPYMVIGGQAVIQHGEPRFTHDVDITVWLTPHDVQAILPVMSGIGIAPGIEDVQAFVSRTHILPCFSRDSRLRVDLSFTDTPYEHHAIARGADVMVEGVPVRFASPEDLLIHKLLAWRPIDQLDIRGILLKQPDMDIDDVRYWCGLFEESTEQPILERLDHALREIRD